MLQILENKYPESTILVFATGTSLRAIPLKTLQSLFGNYPTIGINGALLLPCPSTVHIFADAVYGTSPIYGNVLRQHPVKFKNESYYLFLDTPLAKAYIDKKPKHLTYNASGLRSLTSRNYRHGLFLAGTITAALHLAYIMGAAKIVIFGLDGYASDTDIHFHDIVESAVTTKLELKCFKQQWTGLTNVKKFMSGVVILNANKKSIIPCFSRIDLQEMLDDLTRDV